MIFLSRATYCCKYHTERKVFFFYPINTDNSIDTFFL